MKELSKSSRVLVVGLGKRSGLSACNFLSKKGYNVVANDIKPVNELSEVTRELDNRVKVVAGSQNPVILDEGFDLVVLSPGVPGSIPLLQKAYDRGIPVIAEVELAYRYMKGKLIGITGTDGKSTTTSLVAHIFKELGFRTFAGGNLGIPFISFAEETDDETISVIELSSFQLETIHEFRPDVAAVLNVSPDHLDRYRDMDEYLNAKLRVAMNQTEEDFYIYKKDDQMLKSSLAGIRAAKLSFSLSDKSADAYFMEGAIFVNDPGRGRKALKVLDTSRLRILGMHNIENSMAAVLMAASVLKKTGAAVDYKSLGESCYSFKGLSHRMELIGTVNGRTFINDSKATTVGAVETAIKSIPAGSVLIMGGRTKGDDYSRLAQKIKEKIKHLVLIGESAGDFSRLYKSVPNEIAGSMDEAVQKAAKASSANDVIILSPACASFDMFRNFEERGDRFRESVLRLKKGELSWN